MSSLYIVNAIWKRFIRKMSFDLNLSSHIWHRYQSTNLQKAVALQQFKSKGHTALFLETFKSLLFGGKRIREWLCRLYVSVASLDFESTGSTLALITLFLLLNGFQTMDVVYNLWKSMGSKTYNSKIHGFRGTLGTCSNEATVSSLHIANVIWKWFISKMEARG